MGAKITNITKIAKITKIIKETKPEFSGGAIGERCKQEI